MLKLITLALSKLSYIKPYALMNGSCFKNSILFAAGCQSICLTICLISPSITFAAASDIVPLTEPNKNAIVATDTHTEANAETNKPKPVNPDESQPIQIQSDSAEFDDKKGTALYRGNVLMTQGTRQLISDTLLIQRDGHGKIELMIATGLPARFQAQLSPEHPEKPLGHGQANTVKFFPKEDKIYLFENAELTENDNTIKGDSLTYFINTKVLSANPVPGKRTTVILAPRKKDANGTTPLTPVPVAPDATVPSPSVKGFAQ